MAVVAALTTVHPAGPVSAAEATDPVPLPLSSYFDNDGISSASARDGDFDGSGYTFPAEELAPGGRVTRFTVRQNQAFYITSLTPPGDQVVVTSPLPIRVDDMITMLGYQGGPLRWTKRDGQLVIDVPAAARESGSHAWVFKIS